MSDQRFEGPKFSVDTHLFRELGELLVGRESTALIELVKNSYDADATVVSVYGENLGDPDRGFIRVTDNGNGMDKEVFEKGFLRIASRLKADSVRKSPKYGRRFTGAKGVGRLSAHKLARKIEVHSVSEYEPGSSKAIVGHIDWDKVESAETLEQIPFGAVSVAESTSATEGNNGTTLTLGPLRGKWTKNQLSRFLIEVDSLRAPSILVNPLPGLPDGARSLFSVPIVIDSMKSDPGLQVNLEGDFQTGDNYWNPLLDSAAWILEIAAQNGVVEYMIIPTKKTIEKFPAAEIARFSESIEALVDFQARVLIREGSIPNSVIDRGWASRVSGIRVYMESFRVLPYGDEGDDWLSLSRDYSQRAGKLKSLEESDLFDRATTEKDAGLSMLPNRGYVGGVFLTVDRARSLQMLVNREGFVPGASFESLVKAVRRGIDLSTRVRVSTRTNAKELTPETADEILTKSLSPKAVSAARLQANKTIEVLESQRDELHKISGLVPVDIREKVEAASAAMASVIAVTKDAIPASSMILILASVGTQLAAFTHEIHRLLAMASDLEYLIQETRRQRAGICQHRCRGFLKEICQATARLRTTLVGVA